MKKLSVTGAERMSLRFTRKEIEGLLFLLELPKIPGTAFAPREPDQETLESLETGDWIQVYAESCMINRIAAMVMTNMAFSRAYLTVFQPENVRCIALNVCRQMVTMLRDNGGKWIIIEPLESATAAKHPFFQELKALKTDWTIALNEGTPVQGSIDSAEKIYRELEEKSHADDHR